MKVAEMSNSTVIIGMANYISSPPSALFEQLTVPAVGKEDLVAGYLWILQFMTWSTFWKVLLVFSILANFKNFPLIYHLRILNGVRFVLRSQRSSKTLSPDQLFQPLITSSKATLMETDVFGHKSNSTYFSDIDIARVHLLTTLFSKAIEDVRGSTTMNGLSGKARSGFTLPLGAVCCSFRRELKPYETYDMWTRILSWDEKWFYLVTHFVKKGAKVEPHEFTLYPRQSTSSSSSRKGSLTDDQRRGSRDSTTDGPNPAIAASALSKIVFKNNRRTLKPEMMLELAGLLPKKEENSESVRERVSKERSESMSSSDRDADSGYDSPSHRHEYLTDPGVWTREVIEAERKRGMKQASLLAGLSALENEFNEEIALGRHYDGHGFEGVAATLAQLGGMSNYQLL